MHTRKIKDKIQGCIFRVIKMAVLTKEIWIEKGLQVLKEQGFGELSIVKLANKLNVTRGSFYHHFKSLNDLIDCMIASWEERIVTKGFEKTLINHKQPEQEFRNLINYVTQLNDRLDLVFRQWATNNPHVKAHMERLDQKRLSMLIEVFQRLANNEQEGTKLAKIAFYAYIGSLHTFPYPSAKEQKKGAEEMFEVVITYLNSLNN